MLSAKPTKSIGFRASNRPNEQTNSFAKKNNAIGWFFAILASARLGNREQFFRTRACAPGRTRSIYTRVGMAGILIAVFLTFSNSVLAESSSSTSYRLDYARFTSDSEQKTSSSYQLTDSISDISVEGSSTNYLLRNVYPDTMSAVAPVCGNGIIETGEQCESTDFNDLTCSDYGFDSGTLSCVSCTIVPACFNTGGGGGNLCGNGIREASEQCDDGNIDAGDGCNTYCRIEIPPLEPPEEEPEPVEEPEFVFNPKINLVLDFPDKEPDYIPPRPPLRPVAPDIGNYDYQYESYKLNEGITVLDETPFIVTDLKPNAIYEMLVWDNRDQLIERQGVKADPEGIVMAEVIAFLNFENYFIELRNANRETVKAYSMTIEDRKYQLHDNLIVNGEISKEYIALGNFFDTVEMTGAGKPNTKYYVYLQKVERQQSNVSPITYITATADEYGDYQINFPENLEDGSYIVNMVQVYEDGKVSRNKRYIFTIESRTARSHPAVLIVIALTTLLGIFLKDRKPPRKKKRKKTGKSKRRKLFRVRTIALTVAMSMLMQISLANAVVTTPTVFIYEGKLLDASGTPITTAQTFRFSLWSSDDFIGTDLTVAGAIDITAPAYGGWFEEHTLTPNTDGTFFVELGSLTALPDMLIGTHDNLMVEIKTSGNPDTSYELMDPTGDSGADTDDRQTLGSVPFTSNADFIDNAELGTAFGDIATLSIGNVWDINFIPEGTNSDSWTIDFNDTVGIGGVIELIFGDTLGAAIGFDVSSNWFEFNKNVSFEQNEIKNVALDNLAVAPAAPVTGQIYYNTVDGNTYIWNGIAWEDITDVGDLDKTYDIDADKKMDVDNIAGLEFESTVSGDIVIDLQSTGDFVIQDSGTPFTIFTDGGRFGVGNTSPLSVFHIDSNAINTTAIATFENTAGDFQLFRSDATPEGSITGSIGDLTIDGTNGNAFIKNSGIATATGWIQIGGSEGKTEVFNAEYEDSTIIGDGSDNRGLLSSYFVDGGGTAKYNYYEWTTRRATLQDVDIVISYRLPEDFQSFTSTPLSLLYSTSDGVIATNQIDVEFYDTAGNAVALTGGTDLANAVWTIAGITFGGGETFTAGDVVTLVIRPHTTSSGYARVSDVIFNYNGT